MTLSGTGRSKQAKARKERHVRAVKFFYDHAGYGYDPKTETPEQGRQQAAEMLATAEEYAFAHDWQYEWSDDWSVDHQTEYDCYKDGGPETCESCVLYDPNAQEVSRGTDMPKTLASLGCIDDADADYRRVIQAELALEAMPD